MKGGRDKYSDLGDDESYLSFFQRHTNKKDYSTFISAYNHLMDFCEKNSIEVDEVGDAEATDFCLYLKREVCGSGRTDCSQEQAEVYVSYLSQLFSWVVSETEYLDWEPFEDVYNEGHFEYDDRDEKPLEVPLNELRQHVQNAVRPLELVIVMILLKTGLRQGELVDLNLTDIHLDHPISQFMPAPRREIADFPDSLYVDSTKPNSKKKSFREIPIDRELKSVLVWYLKMRPPACESVEPFLVDLDDQSGFYSRLDPGNGIFYRFRRWAEREGLWDRNPNNKNIHPHWCRHWFTTVLRVNVSEDDLLMGSPRDYVKGLRGDTDDDVIETYSHQWESLRDPDDPAWRDIYENAIPNLLPLPQDVDVEKREQWEKARDSVPDELMPD